jgi:hypothetical protein
MSTKYAFALAIVAALVSTQANAADRRIVIRNQGGQTIYHIYGSNTSETRYGPDRLGEEGVILDGDEEIVDFNDGTSACYFDLKAVFKNGRTVYGKHINVCDALMWVFSEDSNEFVYQH